MLVVVQNLFPNCNAGAMLPVPEMAGTASAVMATLTTAGGALLGAAIGSQVKGSVAPLTTGIFVLSIAMVALAAVASKGHRGERPGAATGRSHALH